MTHSNNPFVHDEPIQDERVYDEPVHDKYHADHVTDYTLDYSEHNEQPQTLELLEERATVTKERIKAGKVVMQKNVRTRTINVPVELNEEYLTVQLTQGDEPTQAFLAGDYADKEVVARFDQTQGAKVTINGRALNLGESVEIVLSREVAIVTKQTHAIEEVSMHTFSETQTHTLATELRHEELVVNEQRYDHR